MKRELGLLGAVGVGLGSILGTGVFVSIGLAAGPAGDWLLYAITLAGLLALCNGLSSAQLAAAHPVSGGTYEYGYRYLTPNAGFAAGVMFMLAKSASASAAALGVSGYLSDLAGLPDGLFKPLALAAVLVLTGVVYLGTRGASRFNATIVTITLISLAGFVLTAWISNKSDSVISPAARPPNITGFFEAAALMFVAYTGYGRVATLGEEVSEPKRTVPLAVMATLTVTMAIYLAVAYAAASALGPQGLYRTASETSAPLETAAKTSPYAWAPLLISIGAVTAMAGVLLNLIWGLSRVLLAMSRRGDAPGVFSRLRESDGMPSRAVLGIGCLIAVLVCFGSVELNWSFSAFTVLIYYAITNGAALRLPSEDQRFPAWVAWLGLAGCLSLACFIHWQAAAAGGAILSLGLLVRFWLKNV